MCARDYIIYTYSYHIKISIEANNSHCCSRYHTDDNDHNDHDHDDHSMFITIVMIILINRENSRIKSY